MRPFLTRALLVGLPIAVSAAACADLFGIHGGEVADASIINLDGATSDAIEEDDAAPFDGGNVDPDANYADCGSGARGVNADAGLFVAVGGSPGSCSLASPCGKISDAITKAASGTTIYVGPGVYTETIELPSTTVKLSFEGGWDIADAGVWVPQCTTNAATIQSDGTHAYTVHLDNVGPLVTFSLLKIVNTPSSVAQGASLYGFLANNSNLELDNVSILVGKAGGGNSSVGTSGTGTSANCSSPSTGNPGGTGGAGNPSTIVATATGFNIVAGSAGSPGTAGENGMAGGPGACIACPDKCVNDGGPSCDGGPPPICSVTTTPQCGGDGGWGCGGMSGPGGSPGTAAGSSVGVYMYAGNLTVNNGAIDVGVGGSGGSGGNGGPGVGGGSAIGGVSTTCFMVGCQMCSPTVCQAMSGIFYGSAEGGAPGTSGGMGGSGGKGGGGAGGYSYDCFKAQNALVTLNGVTFQYGTPSLGGSAAGPNGTSGPVNDF